MRAISKRRSREKRKGHGSNKPHAVRLFNEAYRQKGVLTLAGVASMMRLSPDTISGYVREHETQTAKVVPRRGTIHDIGRSVTHKKIICQKHFKEGKIIEQTARRHIIPRQP